MAAVHQVNLAASAEKADTTPPVINLVARGVRFLGSLREQRAVRYPVKATLWDRKLQLDLHPTACSVTTIEEQQRRLLTAQHSAQQLRARVDADVALARQGNRFGFQRLDMSF